MLEWEGSHLFAKKSGVVQFLTKVQERGKRKYSSSVNS
ncbi:MAG: hypothetical protein Ct9H90mP6_00080 [Gammaproteobacteria bacterium]|nr:MAG: hypothetical protein Ct9H90mP6_00080 [Gammaproteobacteria bacterium]